ncbi:MAG: SNF2-related protein, partial [Cyanobacteria bacterium]|nr:SNF2-related protein [Cyanobacteriota bacterium]
MSGDDNDMAASAAFRDKYKTAEALFLTEGMKRLKPGGVMSVVVPHGVTSGSQHQKLRAELCKHGRVVGVQRLPGDAFEHTGTATVTDVLVMQKHPDHILDAIARGDEAALLAVTDSSFIGGSYFEDNPDHVLGSVEETTNQWGGKTFKVNGSTEAALVRGKAQTLTPTVTYEGLEGVAATPDAGVPIGSTKSINGRQYRFEGDPPRWHRVDDQPTEPVSMSAEDYGHETLEAVHETLQDVGRRVSINPDHLENYLNLAKSDGLLHGSDMEGLKAAHANLDSGKPAERAKIAHAMVLAHHLRQLQSEGAEGAAIRQGLGLLMDYKEKYGSAAGDRTLTRLALDNPALLALQGAFKDDGGISDYWANPSALKNQEERVAGTAAAAAGEAYRAYGANPVNLAQVREFFPSDLPDDEFKAKVLADPSIGYSGGLYMPMQHLIKGDGYDLIDNLQAQQDECAPDSAEYRKFGEQIALVRSRMQLRTFEDMPVSIWNVGSWIPVQAFNEFCSTMGIQLQVEATEDGKFEPTRFVEDKKNKLNQGLLSVLNGEKIRANVTAEKGYLMKDALKDFQADFKDWLAATLYRDEIEDTYNRAFNARLDTEYSGDPLDIQGFDQSGGKRLHDYQCSTVRQMADQGRGIISLGVGLGKTATAIALAMHLKQQGRVKKNGFVVPKSVLANWVKELKFWAPDASVMVLGMSQQYWKDGSEAYEVPGYQMAMVGEKPQTFKDGSPKLRLVGDLKGMVLLTTGKGKAEAYATDEQGNYLLFDEEDSDKPLKQREYTAISPEDLRANSVPLYGGGENLPVKDEQGNFVLFADGDRDRQNPIPFTDAQLKKDGILSMVSDDAATKERKMQQTAQNAFDVVLMSEPVFQRINLTPEKYQEYVQDTVKRHINPDGGFAKDLSVRAAKRMNTEGPTDGDI